MDSSTGRLIVLALLPAISVPVASIPKLPRGSTRTQSQLVSIWPIGYHSR
jgi:hypothetical protein